MSFVIDSCTRHALKDHPERNTNTMVYKFNGALRTQCRYTRDTRNAHAMHLTTMVEGKVWELVVDVKRVVGKVNHVTLITAYPL